MSDDKKYNMDILSLNETNLDESIDTDTINTPVGYDRGFESRGVG